MASTECTCDSVWHIDRYAYKHRRTYVRLNSSFPTYDLIALFADRSYILKFVLHLLPSTLMWAIRESEPRTRAYSHGRATQFSLRSLAQSRNASQLLSTFALANNAVSREAAINIQQNREISLSLSADSRTRMKIEKV